MSENTWPSVYDDETIITVRKLEDMKRLGLEYSDEAYSLIHSPWGYLMDIDSALKAIRENTLGIMDNSNIMNIVNNWYVMPQNTAQGKPKTIKVMSCLEINNKRVPITIYEDRGICGDSPDSAIVRYNTLLRLLCTGDLTPEDIIPYEDELDEGLVQKLLHNFSQKDTLYKERMELFDTLLNDHKKRMARYKREWIKRHTKK